MSDLWTSGFDAVGDAFHLSHGGRVPGGLGGLVFEGEAVAA